MKFWSSLCLLFFIPSLFATVQIDSKQEKLNTFCSKMNHLFKHYHWNKIICNPQRWRYEMLSNNGDPLLYQEFMNNPRSDLVTFIFCGIHGDELPSTYLCIYLVRDIIFDNPDLYASSNIVVAPLANPDSFFSSPPQRVNAHGVDLNRNFPTKDWEKDAMRLWKQRYKSAARRYPGERPGSEVETQFLVNIIKQYKPFQVISIHGPYGFWDYDYDKQMADWPQVRLIAQQLGRKSRNFPVKDYRVFPGSLGNYAGNDLKIPAYTLELNSVRARDAHYLWLRFRHALRYLLQHPYKKN